ncbi:MAG: hypothetical protein ACPGQV_13040 [Alphaproteobacteria bacterium]
MKRCSASVYRNDPSVTWAKLSRRFSDASKPSGGKGACAGVFMSITVVDL